MCTRVERICHVDPAGWYATKPVTELVRCLDCKWFLQRDENGGWCRFSQHGYQKPNDYCSDAERKETE